MHRLDEALKHLRELVNAGWQSYAADLEVICTAAEGSLEALFARMSERFDGYEIDVHEAINSSDDLVTEFSITTPGRDPVHSESLAAALLSALTEAEER